jgi:hypothetical protein
MPVSSENDILLPRNPTAALQAAPKQYVDNPRVVALTDATTIVVDATLGNIFDVTLSGNRTLGNPTGAVNGQKLLFRIKQDATGGRTLTFDTKYRFGTDLTSVVLSTAAGKLDRVGVEYVAVDDKFDVIALAKGY